MSYLNLERLEAVDAQAFRTRVPYPWINPEALLTENGYQRLLNTLPEPSQFQHFFGIKRSHGQQPHDRLTLEYHEKLDVADEWHAFVEELHGPHYRRFLQRLFGRRPKWLSFHWHYTPRGCSVSPHCDAKRKLGSHIFYFNTEADWDPAWGGETLILDDGGSLLRNSAPCFEDFKCADSGVALGNYSLLFARQNHSWHGVREIQCPEGAYRKVFIAVIDDWALSFLRRTVHRLRGKRAVGY